MKELQAQKLKELRTALKLTQEEFAKSLDGVSKSLINSIESKDRNISENLNQKIFEKYHRNLLEEINKEKYCQHAPENIISIPFYRVAAAAGNGTVLTDEPECNMMYFDKRFLKQLLKTDNYSHLHLIQAQGDSMDSGWNQPDDIKDGDLLMVDTSQTTGNNQVFVILVNNSELRVKRLFKKGETLYISSNNPKYKEEPYTPDNSDYEIKVIGKVVWSGK